MGIASWFGFSGKPEFDRVALSKSPIMTTPWMNWYFAVTTVRPPTMSVEDYFRQLEAQNHKMLRFVMGTIAAETGIHDGDTIITTGRFRRNVTIVSEPQDDECRDYVTLMRFTQQDPKDQKKGAHLKVKRAGEEWTYGLAPIDVLFNRSLFRRIEETLHVLYGVTPHEVKTWLYVEDGVVRVRHFDGLEYIDYPFEQRLLLYKEHPAVEAEILIEPFLEFVEWVMEKQDDSRYMNSYCKKVEALLKKHELPCAEVLALSRNTRRGWHGKGPGFLQNKTITRFFADPAYVVIVVMAVLALVGIIWFAAFDPG